MRSIVYAVILSATLALFSGLAGAGRAEAQALFFTLAGDVPMPGGMSEVRDTGTAFDKPEGRIVETYAFGKIRAQDVVSFYASALPALGWTRVDDLTFTREGEKLTLSTSSRDGVLTLRVDIAPR